MKKLILIILALILTTSLASAASNYYEFTLNYNNGKYTYDSLEIKPAITDTQINNIPGGYIAEIVSINGSTLNYTTFNLPTTILYDNLNNETSFVEAGGLMELNQSTVLIRLPYFENAQYIHIYDKTISKKLRIDVSEYSQILPEPVIEEKEPKLEDIAEIAIRDELVEPELLWAILLLIIVILAAIAIHKHKRKRYKK